MPIGMQHQMNGSTVGPSLHCVCLYVHQNFPARCGVWEDATLESDSEELDMKSSVFSNVFERCDRSLSMFQT